MAVKRICLIIAYDGTGYHGWQIQDNAVTVESRVTEALRELLQEPVELAGASRTDSGVHALGNVAVFDTETRIPAEKIAIALNHYLPDDIRIQRSHEVAADFHPRYCESTKTYEYRILNARIENPVRSRYCYHVRQILDLEEMKKAAEFLTGTHDFSAFCSAGSQVKSKVRTIYAVGIKEYPVPYGNEGREISILVSGNGFLYNMVRIIAGTLIEVGQGRRSAASVKEAVSEGDRSKAGPTAPPQGLTLLKIRY